MTHAFILHYMYWLRRHVNKCCQIVKCSSRETHTHKHKLIRVHVLILIRACAYLLTETAQAPGTAGCCDFVCASALYRTSVFSAPSNTGTTNINISINIYVKYQYQYQPEARSSKEKGEAEGDLSRITMTLSFVFELRAHAPDMIYTNVNLSLHI